MSNVSSDIIKRALDVVESGDGEEALELLKEWIGGAASGGASPAASPDADAASAASTEQVEDGDGFNDEGPGSENDGAEGTSDPNKKPRKLTAQQLKICREAGIAPEDFLRVCAGFNKMPTSNLAPSVGKPVKIDPAAVAAGRRAFTK